jgi:hypothetical protein
VNTEAAQALAETLMEVHGLRPTPRVKILNNNTGAETERYATPRWRFGFDNAVRRDGEEDR